MKLKQKSTNYLITTRYTCEQNVEGEMENCCNYISNKRLVTTVFRSTLVKINA